VDNGEIFWEDGKRMKVAHYHIHRLCFVFIRIELWFSSGRGWGIFPSATVARLALGPTQPPIQCVPGVKLTTHLHPVPRLKMREAMPPLPHTSSWRCTWLSNGCVFMSWFLVEHRDTSTFTLWDSVLSRRERHYPMGIGGSFPGVKAAGTWGWLFVFI
jgi:hypothetical protein